MDEKLNVEEALLGWAATCPVFGQLGASLALHYLREYEGACALRPIAGEAAASEFIDGSRLICYDFFLELMLPLSITSDGVNALNMRLGRIWQQWLLQAEAKGGYPDFGPGRVCQQIKCLSNMPQLAQVYEGGMAKYHFPARIVYLEAA